MRPYEAGVAGAGWKANRKGRRAAHGGPEIVVVLVSGALIAALGWYFFGPRRAGATRLEDGVRRVEVTVRGGYSPALQLPDRTRHVQG